MFLTQSILLKEKNHNRVVKDEPYTSFPILFINAFVSQTRPNLREKILVLEVSAAIYWRLCYVCLSLILWIIVLAETNFGKRSENLSDFGLRSIQESWSMSCYNYNLSQTNTTITKFVYNLKYINVVTIYAIEISIKLYINWSD